MITIQFVEDGVYTIKFDVAEYNKLCKVAIAFSIPVEDAIVAVLNRGMDSIHKQLATEAMRRTRMRELEDNLGGG